MGDYQNKKEEVQHPSHYNVYDREVIDMMSDIWGPEEVAIWCKLSAFKYRMRAGHKNDINIDLAKEKKCLELMKEYKQRAENQKITEPNMKSVIKNMLCD